MSFFGDVWKAIGPKIPQSQPSPSPSPSPAIAGINFSPNTNVINVPNSSGGRTIIPSGRSSGGGSSGGGSSGGSSSVQIQNHPVVQSGVPIKSLTNGNVLTHTGEVISKYQAQQRLNQLRQIRGGSGVPGNLDSFIKRIQNQANASKGRNLYDIALEKAKQNSPALNLKPNVSGVPRGLQNIVSNLYNFLDKFSGGKLTDSKLNKLQDNLNRQVENFNNKYQNISLNQRGYDSAQSVYVKLQQTQNAIDKARAGEGKYLNNLFKESSRFKYSPFTGLDNSKATNLGIVSALADLGVTAIQLPSNLKSFAGNVIKNPASVKNIPAGVYKQVKDAAAQDIQIIRTNPQAGVARVVTQLGIQYVTFKITDKGLDFTGKLTTKAINKLDPLFKGSVKTGDVVKLAGESGKELNLKVVGRIPTESIASQLEKAGTNVNAISSQSDNLVGLIKRDKVIRKPIPNEGSLSSGIKKLLNKFDNKTIKPNELVKLDTQLRASGRKGILERSFFADPNLRIRPSRLGVVNANERATLGDLLKGKITFRKGKPQILLFEKAPIENLPASLGKIKQKLLRGTTLTEKESERLLQYQLKATGKFKPLGFATRESEITLAPGEVVKRVKRIGTIEVKGKRVPIIKTEIVEASSSAKKLLRKLESGTIKKGEFRKLKIKLAKETGFKNVLSYSKKDLKYLSPGRTIAKSLSALPKSYKSKTISYKLSQVKYTSKGKPYVVTKYGTRFISSKKAKSPGKITYKTPTYKVPKSPISPPKYYPKIPVKSPPKSPPKYSPSPFRKGTKTKYSSKQINGIKLNKAIPTFNVYAKSGRRFIKINKGALTRQDALNKGTYAIDNTTAKTFKLVPAGKRKKVDSVPSIERNYYKRAGYKLREYRIKRGRKFGIVPKYIEKRKYGIDTKGEKKGLSIAKYLKQRGVLVKKPKKLHANSFAYKQRINNLRKARKVLFPRRFVKHRKITAAHRKVLLKNLIKARRAKK